MLDQFNKKLYVGLYVIFIPWNKEIYKLAILTGKRVHKLYKTKVKATVLIRSYVIPLSVKRFIS